MRAVLYTQEAVKPLAELLLTYTKLRFPDTVLLPPDESTTMRSLLVTDVVVVDHHTAQGFIVKAPAASRVTYAAVHALTFHGAVPLNNGFMADGLNDVDRNETRIVLDAAAIALPHTTLQLIAESFCALAYAPSLPVAPGFDVLLANSDPYFTTAPTTWAEDSATKLAEDAGAIVTTNYNGLPVKALRLVAPTVRAEPYTWSAPLDGAAFTAVAPVVTARKIGTAETMLYVSITDGTTVVAADFLLTDTWRSCTDVAAFISTHFAADSARVRIGVTSGTALITGIVVGVQSPIMAADYITANYTPFSPQAFTLFQLLSGKAAPAANQLQSDLNRFNAEFSSINNVVGTLTGQLQGMLGQKAGALTAAMIDVSSLTKGLTSQVQMLKTLDNAAVKAAAQHVWQDMAVMKRAAVTAKEQLAISVTSLI